MGAKIAPDPPGLQTDAEPAEAVPRVLQDILTYQGHALSLKLQHFDALSSKIGAAVLSILVSSCISPLLLVVLAISGAHQFTSLVFAALLAALLLPLLGLVGAALVATLPRRNATLHLREGTATIRHWSRPMGSANQVERVRLTGGVGRRVRLTLDGSSPTTVYWARPTDVFTPDGLVWLARQLASHLHVPCAIDLDVEGWNRCMDPVFQRQLDYERLHADNQRTFPLSHRASGLEPGDLHYTHEGWTTSDLAVDREGVKSGGRRIPFEEILDVRPFFFHKNLQAVRDGGYPNRSWLLLRTATETIRVGDRTGTGQRLREIIWLADHLGSLVDKAEPIDRGTLEDVPRELARLQPVATPG